MWNSSNYEMKEMRHTQIEQREKCQPGELLQLNTEKEQKSNFL